MERSVRCSRFFWALFFECSLPLVIPPFSGVALTLLICISTAPFTYRPLFLFRVEFLAPFSQRQCALSTDDSRVGLRSLSSAFFILSLAQPRALYVCPSKPPCFFYKAILPFKGRTLFRYPSRPHPPPPKQNPPKNNPPPPPKNPQKPQNLDLVTPSWAYFFLAHKNCWFFFGGVLFWFCFLCVGFWRVAPQPILFFSFLF